MIWKAIVVLLCVFVVGTCDWEACAETTRVDPNAAGARQKPVAEKADARIEQKITYQSGDKRVHEVIDDLARASGVGIDCGRSRSDWQVRDVPLVVSADDVPLGRLLQSIADAAHLTLRSEKAEGKAEARARTYRVYRTSKGSSEIAQAMGAKAVATLAAAGWLWDAMALVGAQPEAKRAQMTRNDPMLGTALEIATVVAGMGPEAKRTLLAGEPVWLSTEPRAEQSLLQALNAAFAKSQSQGGGSLPPADQVEGVLGVTDEQGAMTFRARVRLPGVPTRVYVQFAADSSRILKLAQAGGIDLPTRPEAKPARSEKETPGSGYIALRSDSDWERPTLKKELTIERPDDADVSTRAARIALLAKASSYTMICEDFQSYVGSADSDSTSEQAALFGKRITLAQALKSFPKVDWFIDEDRRTIVGWAQGWRTRHCNLISQSLYTSLRDKLKGPGVELDDAIVLLDLTFGQREEWISGSRDLNPLVWVLRGFSGPAMPLWKLYASLTPGDKALVRGENGLPLSKFEPGWLVNFLHVARAREAGIPIGKIEDLLPRIEPGTDRALVALEDPQQIAHYAMRVETQAVPAPKAEVGVEGKGNAESTSPTKKSYLYYMSLLSAVGEGKTASRLGRLGLAFPFYTATDPISIMTAIDPKSLGVGSGSSAPTSISASGP